MQSLLLMLALFNFKTTPPAFATFSLRASTGIMKSTLTTETTSRYFSKKRSADGDWEELDRRELKKKPAQSGAVERTESFGPQWHGAFCPETSVKVHTLIMGTHPSITSLAKVQYFGHHQNAFWWIAGDCLGFRRAEGISPSTGKPYKLTAQLVHDVDKVIPYEKQLEVLTSRGFALWDLVGSCERKGSLDNDIKEEEVNSIRDFCDEHPTIQRIIMANGAKQCAIFNKYFGDWWLSGELKPGENDLSQRAFKKWTKPTDGFKNGKIKVYCMPGVSPAAASIPYEVKRDVFREYCYGPGLIDDERLNNDC